MTAELIKLTRVVTLAAMLAAAAPLHARPQGNEAVSRAVKAINERRFSDAISNLHTAIISARNIVDTRQRNDVLAALHFYSAIAFLELNDEESTLAELSRHMELKDPDDRLDESKYSRRFVELYRQVQGTPPAVVGIPFDRIYPSPEGVKVAFVETPVNFWERSSEFLLLATDVEKNAWKTLQDDTSRREFIATFWKERDLLPDTAENEFRNALQKRIAYADHVFGNSTTRGSLSDRGRVFSLLGSPDSIEILHDTIAPSENAPAIGSELSDNQSKLSGAQARAIAEKNSSKQRPAAERWSYSPQRLPVNVPNNGVSYTFVHREGERVVLTAEFFAAKALRDVTQLKIRK